MIDLTREDLSFLHEYGICMGEPYQPVQPSADLAHDLAALDELCARPSTLNEALVRLNEAQERERRMEQQAGARAVSIAIWYVLACMYFLGLLAWAHWGGK